MLALNAFTRQLVGCRYRYSLLQDVFFFWEDDVLNERSLFLSSYRSYVRSYHRFDVFGLDESTHFERIGNSERTKARSQNSSRRRETTPSLGHPTSNECRRNGGSTDIFGPLDKSRNGCAYLSDSCLVLWRV